MLALTSQTLTKKPRIDLGTYVKVRRFPAKPKNRTIRRLCVIVDRQSGQTLQARLQWFAVAGKLERARVYQKEKRRSRNHLFNGDNYSRNSKNKVSIVARFI